MQTEKNGFFKNIIKSIKDFDKYEDFAIASTGKSMKYIFLIILVFSIIIYGLFLYKFSISDEAGLQFFKENILNMDYEQQELQIEGVDDIIIQIKNNTIIPVWIYTLYITSALVDVAILAVLGYIIARISRIRIPYKASFNMAIHALTLPIILELIYIVVHSLTGFEIKHFAWMYTTISYIYMIVAILMIKTDLINRQIELIKLQEEQKKVREEMQKEKVEQEKKDDKEEKQSEDNKEKKKDEQEKDNNIKGEAGTSQA